MLAAREGARQGGGKGMKAPEVQEHGVRFPIEMFFPPDVFLERIYTSQLVELITPGGHPLGGEKRASSLHPPHPSPTQETSTLPGPRD